MPTGPGLPMSPSPDPTMPTAPLSPDLAERALPAIMREYVARLPISDLLIIAGDTVRNIASPSAARAQQQLDRVDRSFNDLTSVLSGATVNGESLTSHKGVGSVLAGLAPEALRDLISSVRAANPAEAQRQQRALELLEAGDTDRAVALASGLVADHLMSDPDLVLRFARVAAESGAVSEAVRNRITDAIEDVERELEDLREILVDELVRLGLLDLMNGGGAPAPAPLTPLRVNDTPTALPPLSTSSAHRDPAMVTDDGELARKIAANCLAALKNALEDLANARQAEAEREKAEAEEQRRHREDSLEALAARILAQFPELNSSQEASIRNAIMAGLGSPMIVTSPDVLSLVHDARHLEGRKAFSEV